ncbi:serine/threonine-protein kinase [Helcococcus kunzii]|nr:serine/threonine-protein kinase [Helcococcus kunzii]MCT1795997.1 serine/threonine protein kinase [Helcococcus kunzii]MCT1988227.1 serine/threonine protein kinase [Helcococcus kunzii]QUY65278.1 serine/threonine protein kinase [Helcococcus kunzii]
MKSIVGSVIENKYEILKEVGRGGMSVVYLAMDIRLNKQWAVKEIKKTGNKNNEIIVNSLIVEANLMKKLDHPSLPRIVDIIDTEHVIYIVMDYIEGESLDRILRYNGPQDEQIVIEWSKQICDVLNYLHSQNPPIIYRDMKPGNVMVKPDGNIKIIDFGIAREYKDNKLTDTTVLGTKGYAAPEQYGKRQSDRRTDIYSLGMTMHSLLTGDDPRNPDFNYRPVRDYNPSISGGIERIIEKCIEIDPNNRYQNCMELMYALMNYEKEDEDYRNKQKKKLRYFAASVILTVIFAATSFTSNILLAKENQKNYASRVNISSSVDYEKRVKSYVEAIDINPEQETAYIKLLDAFNENGTFGETESNIFLSKYNKNINLFDKTRPEFLDLQYKAGTTYYYLFSGGDNSFRTRTLKSKDFFENIVNSDQREYKNYGISKSYYNIAEFFSDFIVNSINVKEPTEADYKSLIDSINETVGSSLDYDSADASFTKLTIFEELGNIINTFRGGFASVQIPKKELDDIFTKMSEEINSMFISQKKTLEFKNRVIQSFSDIKNNINITYKSLGEQD